MVHNKLISSYLKYNNLKKKRKGLKMAPLVKCLTCENENSGLDT